MRRAFRSLRHRNYRLWAAGAIVSNVGTWMQRTAQDWIVLTQLTHGSAIAVGVVMALQFGPQIVLLPVTGYAADRFDRRRILLVTQALMGLLALGLGLLTVTGAVRLWQVDVFALLLGCVAAFDAPARQSFVGALVPASDLSNAVALNSTSFNLARTVGPAIAGLLIAGVGAGWVFLLNAASFAAVLASLVALGRISAPEPRARPQGGIAEGFRYVRARPDLVSVLLALAIIGTFGLNFPIFVSTMTVTVFHARAAAYGLLTSALAVGSVIGALLAARREQPRAVLLVGGAAMFALALAVAALAPGVVLFGVALVLAGIASQSITTTANGLVQLGTDPAMRGRVLAIYVAILLGGTPVGAPVVGWVADAAGPRWGLGVGVAAGIAAVAIGLVHLLRHRHLRLRVAGRRLRVLLDPAPR